jgi:hypothetical protein
MERCTPSVTGERANGAAAIGRHGGPGLQCTVERVEDARIEKNSIGIGRPLVPQIQMIDDAATDRDLRVPPSNHFEKLRGNFEKAPGSLDELARITGKAKSNLSRTLKTMEGYGLVRLERGERGRITPKVMHDRVELDLPLTLSRKAS